MRETKFAGAELSEVEADGQFSRLCEPLRRDRPEPRPGAARRFPEVDRQARGGGHPHALPARPRRADRRVAGGARGPSRAFVSGRLMPEVAKAREVLALMRAGAIDGLSIGSARCAGGRCEERRAQPDRGGSVGGVGGDVPDAAGGKGERSEGDGRSGELCGTMRGAARTIRDALPPPCGGGWGRG